MIKAFDRSMGHGAIVKFLKTGVRVRSLRVTQTRAYLEYEKVPPESCVTKALYFGEGNTSSVPAGVNNLLSRTDIRNVHWGVDYSVENASSWYVITWEEAPGTVAT